MSQTLIIIMIVAIVVVFSLFILFDNPGRKRKDDRDAKKTEDFIDNPNFLYQSQQPAELQIGEEREVDQLSRFAPDAKPRERGATTIEKS
ncbi:MAG: hypothetical protein AB1757_29420 [Acidobacteriota bacterium]